MSILTKWDSLTLNGLLLPFEKFEFTAAPLRSPPAPAGPIEVISFSVRFELRTEDIPIARRICDELFSIPRRRGRVINRLRKFVLRAGRFVEVRARGRTGQRTLTDAIDAAVPPLPVPDLSKEMARVRMELERRLFENLRDKGGYR